MQHCLQPKDTFYDKGLCQSHVSSLKSSWLIKVVEEPAEGSILGIICEEMAFELGVLACKVLYTPHTADYAAISSLGRMCKLGNQLWKWECPPPAPLFHQHPLKETLLLI